MALLDEAMALACGPADDSGVAAQSACSFFTACYHAADFGRASSWSGPLAQQGLLGASNNSQVFLSSHCDTVAATLLTELGRWSEAEAVLVRAMEAFESMLRVRAWHPALGLAELRIRQGRLGEAEMLLLGKDQALEALLPTARLHLARGDAELARAAATRGLRAIGPVDRLRAVELLIVLVDAALALAETDAAVRAARELSERSAGLAVPALLARAAAAEARVRAARGDRAGAVALLESTMDRKDLPEAPLLRALLHVELSRQRDAMGERALAVVEARAALAILGTLDVTLCDADAALLARLTAPPAETPAPRVARLLRDSRWWTLACGDTRVRLSDTKGLRYLAELIARPSAEQHALDLVDRVEGVGSEPALERRRLGDGGPLLDARARSEYRRRIEALRAQADDALELGRHEAAEAVQNEIDQLVTELSRAFGLGGRERLMGSVAERARLNVTRALRAAIAKVAEALPEPGAALDRRVRTGLYCAYVPHESDPFQWVVQSGLNDPAPG
jgi:hypothetical protein